MTDHVARRAIADALDDTLVVEAAAGTGKTTELVNRILRVLATGRARMVQIVAVTFTERAAGELKLRLRERLESERASADGEDVRTRLEDALETLEEAHVNTIHGFCAELLRERPVEACVDPLFTVLTEGQSDRLYSRAFRGWLQDVLREPPEGVRRALRRTSAPAFAPASARADSDGPIDRLRGAGRTLAEWRHFSRPWARRPFDLAGTIDRLVGELHALGDLTDSASSRRDSLFIDTDGVRRLSRQIRLEQSFGQRDYAGWEARLIDLTRDRGFSRTRKGSGYKYGGLGAAAAGSPAAAATGGRDVTRTEVLAARDRLYTNLQQFKEDADADLAALLQRELAGATARYEDLKAAAGALDFTDLLAKARDLIRTNDTVRHYLQSKYSRIFVDEFQDTDPIQAEILLLLAADDPTVTCAADVRAVRGKLFIVGDPKQAIYRFRGTDVGTYWQVSRQLVERGARIVQLTTSYRSVPAIQGLVNAAFSRAMRSDEAGLQPDYVPLAPWRAADGSQPAIVALPVPRPYSPRSIGFRRPSMKAIDESLPDAVGAFIAWLIDERHGWTVSERQADGEERRVPIQPRHIALLFRRFVNYHDDVTRPYVGAIEARGIPHLLVGGRAFHDREEVETIRAALAAIEWPDDELSVFAALKGSLFAIDDARLLEFRHRFGPFHPFRIPYELGGNSGRDLALSADPTAHLTPIADALRILQTLHRGRNYRPVADTIGRLLERTRAHVGFILRPNGEQALANVLHLAELARQYEAEGGISFRGFIDELRDAAQRTEAAEAPILEEGSDGVRLMTVHKAKGLEFPVVILADMTCRMSRDDASRYLDAGQGLCAMKIGGWAPRELHEHETDEILRDQAEGVRLAYVAATRARDLLVIPALGDGPWEGGWFGPLNAGLYPPPGARRRSKRGPKCPAFKSKDSVLHRPDDEPAGASTVCPGLHDFDAEPADAGGYSIVWWDPGALRLGARPPFGVRREELIVRDVGGHVIADARSRYDSWQLARAEAQAAGAVPSIVVDTVRERTGDSASALPMTLDTASVSVVTIAGRESGPSLEEADEWVRRGGAVFGALVHAILAQTPFDGNGTADVEVLRNIALVQARVLGIPEEDVEPAVAAASRALSHDLLQRARRAEARGACRRETPVACMLADGTLVEGIVDLAFEEDGGWTVVDYKTDREIAASGEERYRRQVALYAEAIRRATGTNVSPVLARIRT
jgi:ATP-dependent exoDNAse (exonuclease V) beta subunit